MEGKLNDCENAVSIDTAKSVACDTNVKNNLTYILATKHCAVINPFMLEGWARTVYDKEICISDLQEKDI